MDIVQPRTASEWERYFDLRWRVLRKPWQQAPGSERDPQDDTATHCLILDDKQRAIAVGRLHFNTPDEAQIRFMAVAPEHRGQGLGTAILSELERHARQTCAGRIILDARNDVVAFYTKHGFRVVGPAHILFGTIPHTRMEKSLEI